MGLKQGDLVSTWITCEEAPESNIVHLACYKAGLKLMTFQTGQDLDLALKSSSAFIFSPWEKFENEYRIDHILSKVPTLLTTPTGSLVKSDLKTKYFIQTGYKTIRGTYKLKTIPVYNGPEVSNPGFEINHLGHTVKNQELMEFVKKFGEVVGKGVAVNSLPCKFPVAIGSLIGSYLAGAKSVSCIKSDPSSSIQNHKANVLVTSEEKINLIGSPFSLDKVVISASDKDSASRAVKALEKKGVKFNSVLSFNSTTLSSLSWISVFQLVIMKLNICL